MPRLEHLKLEEMTSAQRTACDEVISGKRGKVPEPMQAWLRNPEMASRTQKLGELLRYDTSLPPMLAELAIIVCARHWTAHVQWSAHKKYALAAGLEPQIAADIAARREPSIADPKTKVVYDVSAALLRHGRVPKQLYADGIELLGERGMAELAVLLGYYCIASFTLNTFEMGLPAAACPELEDPDFAA